MFHKLHSLYIKSLYKRLLTEGSLFFDERARLYVRNRVRSSFGNYKSCTDLERVKSKIKEARKQLHRLEKANKGCQKSAIKVLEEVYGLKGKVRHGLLYPYLKAHRPANFKIEFDPFVPHVPRTAPPPKLCKPLQVLIQKHLQKKIEPILPVPAYKPLHPGRRANLLWRYRSMLLNRVSVPLPFEIICELESKAGAPKDHPLSCSSLGKGGPKWDDFYSSIENAVIMMLHLQPNIKLPARSNLLRKETLFDSPYSKVRTPTLVEFLEEKKGNGREQKAIAFEYTPRRKRRLYQRLLAKIPLIDTFKATELWENTKTYTISKSHWAPQVVHQLLEDVPSQEIRDATLATTNKKTRRNRKK
ncbi:hypothetical protein BDF20DRAFT_691505 [Mycotypha africana]|uniref:uncharacterized protein n=1 Tax=Mycotypha africana TaxID=64632 RepID=UPI00230106A1|nr:uncharacterized protein BDF20DRAFT_691505 [Mycotypha africana]KAI8971651.1 hypothetical protein BDF20DRAFT_691505 [Mycotypha africana]